MNHWDKELSRGIQRRLRGSFAFWSFLSHFGLWGFVLFFLGMWAGYRFSTDVLWRILLALLVSLALSLLLRFLIRRPRPKEFQTSYRALLVYSFPSLHAVSAFAAASALSFALIETRSSIFTWIGVLLMIVLAKLIALSRIAVGVHYYSDVLAGGFIGLVTGLVIMLL